MRSIAQRPALLLGLGAVVAVVAFQLWITPTNPPGFHRDEAALSLNAYTLSTRLRDEDGARLPLFFRSFDDYKSPVYPYVLAGVFTLTGPDQQVARGFSAALVLAAVLLLGMLAFRLTASWLVATIVVVLAGLTPWLFELGRMAIEATTQPLLVVLLLLWLERTVRLERYHVRERRRSRGSCRTRHLLVHGEPPPRSTVRRRARRLRRSGALEIRQRCVGDRGCRARPSRRLRAASSRRPHRPLRGDDDRTGRPVRSPGRSAGGRELVQGHRPVALGNGWRSCAVHPQRRLRGAVRRSRPSGACGHRDRPRPRARQPVVALRPPGDAPRPDSRRAHRRPVQRDSARDAPRLRARARDPGAGRADLGCQDVMGGARGRRLPRTHGCHPVRAVSRHLPEPWSGSACAVRRGCRAAPRGVAGRRRAHLPRLRRPRSAGAGPLASGRGRRSRRSES